MKFFFLGSVLQILCFFTHRLHAQEWSKNLKPDATFAEQKEAFYKYYKNIPLGWSNNEDERMLFMRKERALRYYDLHSPGINPEQETWNAFLQIQNQSQNKSAQAAAANWSSLGPFGPISIANGAGRLISVKIDPTNNNIIWVGSGGGGLWKSTTGGNNWVPMQAGMPNLGVADIAIDPTNTNNMYIATGDKEAGGYSFGVFKSTNGGLTWAQTPLSYSITQNKHVSRLLLDNTNPNKIFATSSDGIWRTMNAGTSWSLVKPGVFYDIQFNSAGTNTLYATSDSVYKSIDGGTTWKSMPTSPTFSVTWGTRVLISTTAADPNYLFVLDNNYKAYKSVNGGVTWTNIFSTVIGFGAYDMVIGVSPADTNEVYIGGGAYYKSLDAGKTFTMMPCCMGLHLDQQNMTFDASGTTIYGVNDGGVYKSTNGAQTWTDISNGLNVTEYYRFGSSANSKTELFAGGQDNGIHRYRGGNWFGVYPGDESETFVDPLDSNTFYWSQGALLVKSNDAGLTYTICLQDTGDYFCPYVMHPTNNQTIFFGGNMVKKTTNGGATWTPVSPALGYYINSMAVAKSNPNYIYAASMSGIYTTTNGGLTWNNITSNFPLWFGFVYTSYMAVSATNPLHVWITMPGYTAGNKVFETTNGGLSWFNSSSGLPNVNARTIVYNNNSLNDEIYLGTDIGVFYKDNSMSSWLPYNTNLPAVIIQELEVHYLTGTLRACTYGRGIWESPLITAIPMGIENNSVSESQPILFPNPASHFIKIQGGSGNENINSVCIYNLMGQKIMQFDYSKISLNDVEIKTESLSNGVYFIDIKTNKGNYTQKVIISSN